LKKSLDPLGLQKHRDPRSLPFIGTSDRSSKNRALSAPEPRDPRPVASHYGSRGRKPMPFAASVVPATAITPNDHNAPAAIKALSASQIARAITSRVFSSFAATTSLPAIVTQVENSTRPAALFGRFSLRGFALRQGNDILRNRNKETPGWFRWSVYWWRWPW